MEAVGYDMYIKLLSEAIAEEKGEQPEKIMDCMVDIQINAHIPESYIYNLNQRIEVYRRIADIRNMADCDDVKDELRDRFGEIPAAVEGLIEIALIRNSAVALGIYEIRQKDSSLLLYIRDIRSEGCNKILLALGRQASLGGGTKPYISVKFPKGMDISDVLRAVFGRL
jgi:transcription-repair coupling factor (superfamily II helicase)